MDTLQSSTAYISLYYPNLVDAKSPVWEFQERLRIEEAKNFSSNPERAARGWIALDSIRSSPSVSMIASLPKEYVDFIRSKVDTLEEKKDNNVRRAVKDVWMWPLTGFCPWNKFDLTAGGGIGKRVVDIANVILSSTSVMGTAIATPRLVEGKIYLTLSGFRSSLWKMCAAEGIDLGTVIPGLIRPLTENFETEHITLVNSDVLANCLGVKTIDHPEKKEKLNMLLDKWSSKPLKFSVNSLMHTISLDWARFGICLVAGIDLLGCPMLIEFMNEFNTLMNTAVKITSPHITIAIDSRC